MAFIGQVAKKQQSVKLARRGRSRLFVRLAWTVLAFVSAQT